MRRFERKSSLEAIVLRDSWREARSSCLFSMSWMYASCEGKGISWHALGGTRRKGEHLIWDRKIEVQRRDYRWGAQFSLREKKTRRDRTWPMRRDSRKCCWGLFWGFVSVGIYWDFEIMLTRPIVDWPLDLRLRGKWGLLLLSGRRDRVDSIASVSERYEYWEERVFESGYYTMNFHRFCMIESCEKERFWMRNGRGHERKRER